MASKKSQKKARVGNARKGKLVSKKLTRGPRKGQVVQGYMSKGKFKPVKTNRQKGNARAGKKYVTTRDSKGRKVHQYRINGKTVNIVIKKSKKKGKKGGRAGSSSFRK